LINKKADDQKRLKVARISIAVATIAAGLVALDPPGVITQIVPWAFSLAAASFFPVLVLGSGGNGSMPLGLLPA